MSEWVGRVEGRGTPRLVETLSCVPQIHRRVTGVLGRRTGRTGEPLPPLYSVM